MEFKSFEEAMETFMTAEEGSDLQNKAAVFAIQHAPEDLKDKLVSVAMKNFPGLSGLEEDSGEKSVEN